jgi:hypothetical protein
VLPGPVVRAGAQKGVTSLNLPIKTQEPRIYAASSGVLVAVCSTKVTHSGEVYLGYPQKPFGTATSKPPHLAMYRRRWESL